MHGLVVIPDEEGLASFKSPTVLVCRGVGVATKHDSRIVEGHIRACNSPEVQS